MMKKNLIIGLIIVFVVLVLAVVVVILKNQGGPEEGIYKPGVILPAPLPSESFPLLERDSMVLEQAQLGQTGIEDSSRLVIKTGTISMVVKDIEEAVRNITRHTEEKSGWVVSSSIAEEKEIPRGYIEVRLPAEFFGEAMIFFKGLAEKIDFESTQGRDVTEEYVDLEARLKNLEVTETQLLKIMERSGEISDVLEVQRELTRVREQIETIKGRTQYLEQSSKMATITVNLTLAKELLPVAPAEKWRPNYVFQQAWQNVLVFLKGVSYFLIWLVTYAVIWVPLGAIIWLVARFLKKKKETASFQ